jgi:hypothetical protein
VSTEGELARIVDEACRDAETFIDIATRLEQVAGEPAPDSPLACGVRLLGSRSVQGL